MLPAEKLELSNVWYFCMKNDAGGAKMKPTPGEMFAGS